MEELAKKVKLGDFRYSRIKRAQAKHTGKHIALYRADCVKDDGKLKHIGYEVIIIQIRKEATFHTPSKIGADGKRKKAFDTVVPEHEAYPGAGEFGRHGWYYHDLKAANERFDDLINALPHNAEKVPEPPPPPKKAVKRSVAKGCEVTWDGMTLLGLCTINSCGGKVYDTPSGSACCNCGAGGGKYKPIETKRLFNSTFSKQLAARAAKLNAVKVPRIIAAKKK